MKITMGGALIQLDFTRNNLASGDLGQSVQPGSCAFIDREVSSNEPTIIYIPGQAGQGTVSNTAYSVLVDRISENHFLQSALLAPNTLIRFMVRNSGNSFETSTGVFGVNLYTIIPNAPAPLVMVPRMRLPRPIPNL